MQNAIPELLESAFLHCPVRPDEKIQHSALNWEFKNPAPVSLQTTSKYRSAVDSQRPGPVTCGQLPRPAAPRSVAALRSTRAEMQLLGAQAGGHGCEEAAEGRVLASF